MRLTLPLIKKAWLQMQGWYKTVFNRPPNPVRIKLAQITTVRVDIYRRMPLHGERITIEEELF